MWWQIVTGTGALAAVLHWYQKDRRQRHSLLDEVYKAFIRAQDSFIQHVHLFQPQGNPDEIHENLKLFGDILKENKLKINCLVHKASKHINGEFHRRYQSICIYRSDDGEGDGDYLKQRNEVLIEAWDFVTKKLPGLRQKLERRIRWLKLLY